MDHHFETIKRLKRILSILDVISYFMAFYELFVEKAVTVGLIITLASLALNVLISYLDNEKKILHVIEIFKWRENGKEPFRYFRNLIIVYILVEIICLWIASSFYAYVGLFWGIFVIFPVVYSASSVILKLMFNESFESYAKLQMLLAIAPIIFMFVVLMFGNTKFVEKFAAIVVCPLLLLPVGGTALWAKEIIAK